MSKIKNLKDSIEEKKEHLLELEKELALIEKSTKIETVELFNGIENYFTAEVKHENFKFILGGGLRSQPYDETRKGNVLHLTYDKDYYFTDEQKKVIREYCTIKYKFDIIKEI